MTHIELAPEVAEDFDRILDHLMAQGVADAAERIHDIIAAIDVLARNPMLGRPAGSFDSELVIGRRSHGYLVLYRHVPEFDIVFVLAVRSQREAGYGR